MESMKCPTAQTMLALSRSLEDQPIQTYLCSWIALDNVVRVIARQSGLKPQFVLRKNGTLKMTEIGNLRMPKVTSPGKSLIYTTALEQLDRQVKHALIVHPNVGIFAHRTPALGNRMVKTDTRGQLLNGVIDVSKTMDPRNPVWCPITMEKYKAYIRGEVDDVTRQELVQEIVVILDTIRENLLYACTSDEQECGINLVTCAQPLLNILIFGLTVST
jgi:hypothetical protein